MSEWPKIWSVPNILLISYPVGTGRLQWIWSAILAVYLIGMASWLALNRWRHRRWVSWGGQDLSRIDVSFVLLVVATFLVIAVVMPFNLFGIWFLVAALVWVLALILTRERLSTKREK